MKGSWRISLAPGFSPGLAATTQQSCFNSFVSSRVGKRLKPFLSVADRYTRLKPRANERLHLPHKGTPENEMLTVPVRVVRFLAIRATDS